eukprot:scaffold527_cov368-Prasinococcus_capsulatus_cf.AAC.51
MREVRQPLRTGRAAACDIATPVPAHHADDSAPRPVLWFGWFVWLIDCLPSSRTASHKRAALRRRGSHCRRPEAAATRGEAWGSRRGRGAPCEGFNRRRPSARGGARGPARMTWAQCARRWRHVAPPCAWLAAAAQGGAARGRRLGGRGFGSVEAGRRGQPAEMEGILPASHGPCPHLLRVGTMPVPTVQRGEVLLKVHATALNRLDVLQRLGKYPVPAGASNVLGVECAGTVVQLGEGSSKWYGPLRMLRLTTLCSAIVAPRSNCSSVTRGSAGGKGND